MYNPQRISVKPEDLPQELQPVLEKLAERVHDTWAAGRFEENWVYGPTRDDAKKTHPDLVPYGELPESERQYDRYTAAQTIQYLLDMGYHIIKKDDAEQKNV